MGECEIWVLPVRIHRSPSDAGRLCDACDGGGRLLLGPLLGGGGRVDGGVG